MGALTWENCSKDFLDILIALRNGYEVPLDVRAAFLKSVAERRGVTLDQEMMDELWERLRLDARRW